MADTMIPHSVMGSQIEAATLHATTELRSKMKRIVSVLENTNLYEFDRIEKALQIAREESK